MDVFCMMIPDDRGSYWVRRLLGHALWETHGIELPEILKTPEGKPYFPSMPHLHFSLSHTDGCVLCAIDDSPVGADIQKVRPYSPKLPERLCSLPELRQFDFFDLWSLKESFIKLRGKNDVPLRDTGFTLENGHITADGNIYGKTYAILPGYSIAVCSYGRDFPDNIRFVDKNVVRGT